MRLSNPVRLLGVVVIALAAFVAAFQPVRFSGTTPLLQSPHLHVNLGLDLQGGSHIVLQAEPTPETPMSNDAMDGVLRIIRNRVDQLGVAEPAITRQGRDRILVELPGIQNPQRAIDLIGKTALLEFVDTATQSLPQGAEWQGTDTVILPDKRQLKVPKKIVLTGADLKDAQVQYDPYGRPEVGFTFKSSAAKTFGDYTTKNVGKFLTIVLDNRVISSPVINSPIPEGRGVIEGGFTLESARDLAVLLRGGALPLPVKIVENRTVGPLLGRDSIDRSLRAGNIAFVLVGLFMLLYYRLPGFLADLALGVYTLILFALLSLLGATLTLPGIAGFILSLGVAVDANVIIFEKVKEELRARKTLRAAVSAGWSRAIVTIFDSNTTTLIGAAVLLWLGTGPVRGFAVTLILGILTSIFTAIVVTRVFVDLVLETPLAGWIQSLASLGRGRPLVPVTGGAGAGGSGPAGVGE
ncbi:MAG TPA: protein translocase subunit SecD [bacterium]|nr:protein translocase subunit SecD [bacterium]